MFRTNLNKALLGVVVGLRVASFSTTWQPGLLAAKIATTLEKHIVMETPKQLDTNARKTTEIPHNEVSYLPEASQRSLLMTLRRSAPVAAWETQSKRILSALTKAALTWRACARLFSQSSVFRDNFVLSRHDHWWKSFSFRVCPRLSRITGETARNEVENRWWKEASFDLRLCLRFEFERCCSCLGRFVQGLNGSC